MQLFMNWSFVFHQMAIYNIFRSKTRYSLLPLLGWFFYLSYCTMATLQEKTDSEWRKIFNLIEEIFLLGCYYSIGGTNNEMAIMDLNPFLIELIPHAKMKI